MEGVFAVNKDTASSHLECLSGRASLACGYREHWLQGIAGASQNSSPEPVRTDEYYKIAAISFKLHLSWSPLPRLSHRFKCGHPHKVFVDISPHPSL